MTMFKIILILSILSFTSPIVYLRSTKCNSWNPQALEVKVCFYNEDSQKLEIQFDIKKSILSIWVDMAFLLKIGSKYRRFGSMEKLDWCVIVKRMKSIKNPYVKNMISSMKQYLPQAFRCPFQGLVDVNTHFRNEVLNVLPPGNYNLDFKFYDKKSPDDGVDVSLGFEQTLSY
jgi:hypothetical protein